MDTHETIPTLFVIENCGACNRAIAEFPALFLKQGRQLLIRKPYLEEAKLLPGEYPVLHIPKDGEPPVIIVGLGARDVLRRQPDLIGYNDVVPEPSGTDG